jgi:hypothetical protein
MGWDSCSSWTTKKHVTDYLKKSILDSGWIIHGEKSVRDGIWYVIERAGEKIIYLGLIERHNKEYALKTLPESSGPRFYSCPLSFLDKTPCPGNEWSIGWREKVKAFHQRSKFRPEVGMRFRLYDDKVFEVVTCTLRGTTKRWIVKDDEGNRYYLKSSQYKDMILVTEEKASA